MTKYIEVLDPTGITEQKIVQVSGRVGNLNGKYIGFIDNGKPNYDIFLARLMELLNQRFKFVGIVNVKKKEKDTGTALNSADMEKLITNCDIVINGICDWGSCTTWSIHDSTELEKKGKPTVTLCSDAFNNLAKTIAASRGMPALRMVVIPHPIAGIPAEQVCSKADKAIDDIIKCLIENNKNT